MQLLITDLTINSYHIEKVKVKSNVKFIFHKMHEEAAINWQVTHRETSSNRFCPD